MEKKYYLILQCLQNFITSENRFNHCYSYCVTDESITQFILNEANTRIEKKQKHAYIVMNYWEITKEEYDELYEYYG